MKIINKTEGENSKEIQKSITELASKMPSIVEEYKVPRMIKGSEAKNLIHESWSQEQKDAILDLDPEKSYKFTQTALRPINHKRRMFKAYNEGGKTGLAKYIIWHNQEFKRLKELYPSTEIKTQEDEPSQN